MASTDSKPIILCALDFEASILDRAGLAARATLVCTGPGPARMVSWAEAHGASASVVILAGLAGSLRAFYTPGECYVTSTVCSPQGRQFHAGLDVRSLMSDQHRVKRAIVASSNRVMRTPAEKHAFAERTGADLVDLESAVFAEAASVFGWRWAVIRGVSDGINDTLPENIERWTTIDGFTRPWRIAGDLLMRPLDLMRVIRLRQHSIDSMKRTASICEALLDGFHHESSATEVIPS